MADYFDFDNRPMNDDAYDREENRPRISLEEALGFDKEYVNRILNYEHLEDADKYNIASVVSRIASEYFESCRTSKDFEDFLIEVNGKEWHENMIRAWLRRKTMKIAKNWGCPELADSRGVYFYMQGEGE